MQPYSSSNGYKFRPDCDAYRLTHMPVEERDYGEWKSFDWCYLPREHQGIAKDALILDVGSEEGDTAVFFFEHGYTNLRLVEPYPAYWPNLKHNVEILRSLGCKVDLRLEPFDPKKHFEGAAYIKFDAEGAEWGFCGVDKPADERWALINCGVPWGAELHMGNAPPRPGSEPKDGVNDYYCSIGLFRGNGKNQFRQLDEHNMKKRNWSFFEEPADPRDPVPISP